MKWSFMEEYSPMYLNWCYTYKKSVLVNKGENKNYGLISNIIPTFTQPNGTRFLQTKGVFIPSETPSQWPLCYWPMGDDVTGVSGDPSKGSGGDGLHWPLRCQQTVLANDRVRKIYFGFQLFRNVIMTSFAETSRDGGLLTNRTHP